MPEHRARDAAACRNWQGSRHGYIPRTWWMDPSWIAVWLARRSFAASTRGRHRMARLYVQLNSILTGMDVEADSKIGPGLLLTNPLGVSLWIDAGKDLTFHALSGSGNTMRNGQLEGKPIVGDSVEFGAFSGAQGPIDLGDDVQIRPGASALRSVKSGLCVSQRVAMRIHNNTGETLELTEPPSGAPQPCSHRSLSVSLQHWRSDRDRLMNEAEKFSPDAKPGRLSAALLNQNMALLVHRLAHLCHMRNWRRVANILTGFNRWIFKLTIPPHACLGPGVWLPHLAGTIVHAQTGPGLTGFAQTCLMPRHGPFAPLSHAPIVAENVLIAAHAGAFGSVHLGAQSTLSRKANIVETVPPGTTVFAEASAAIFGQPNALPIRKAETTKLPSWRAVKQEDHRARLRFETNYGKLPLQSRLAVHLFRKAQFAFHANQIRKARTYWLVSRYMTGADISARSQIGPGFVVVCAPGVTFDGAAGRNLTLMGQLFVGGVTLDGRRAATPAETPELGENITLYPHTVVYGGCTIGDKATIDAGVTISQDVPEEYYVAAPNVRNRTRRIG